MRRYPPNLTLMTHEHYYPCNRSYYRCCCMIPCPVENLFWSWRCCPFNVMKHNVNIGLIYCSYTLNIALYWPKPQQIQRHFRDKVCVQKCGNISTPYNFPRHCTRYLMSNEFIKAFQCQDSEVHLDKLAACQNLRLSSEAVTEITPPGKRTIWTTSLSRDDVIVVWLTIKGIYRPITFLKGWDLTYKSKLNHTNPVHLNIIRNI